MLHTANPREDPDPRPTDHYLTRALLQRDEVQASPSTRSRFSLSPANRVSLESRPDASRRSNLVRLSSEDLGHADTSHRAKGAARRCGRGTTSGVSSCMEGSGLGGGGPAAAARLLMPGERRSALVIWGRPFRAPRLGSASSHGQRDNHERRLAPERRRTAMARKLRCRLGKHRWRCRGRGDALTYFCEVCRKTRDKPPRRSGGAEAPWWPGTG
jgi:hypothetical protein